MPVKINFILQHKFPMVGTVFQANKIFYLTPAPQSPDKSLRRHNNGLRTYVGRVNAASSPVLIKSKRFRA